MRSRPLIAALCLLTVLPITAFAQKEASMEDRLLRPSKDLRFESLTKQSNIGKSFQGARSVPMKDFYFRSRFRSKDYLTGSFHGQLPFWMGDFRYNTKADIAAQKTSTDRLTRDYATKAMETKIHRDTDKVSRYAQQTSDAVGKVTSVPGRSQYQLNQKDDKSTRPVGWSGDLHQMNSVEDIRALLNKDQNRAKGE